MELPNKLEPVIADIRHQSETGKHQWYEVVYHDGEKWCHYAGSDTFNDGESVKEWKYTKDIFSSQLEPPVKPANGDIIKAINEFFDDYLLDVDNCLYVDSIKFKNNINFAALILLQAKIDLLSRLSV